MKPASRVLPPWSWAWRTSICWSRTDSCAWYWRQVSEFQGCKENALPNAGIPSAGSPNSRWQPWLWLNSIKTCFQWEFYWWIVLESRNLLLTLNRVLLSSDFPVCVCCLFWATTDHYEPSHLSFPSLSYPPESTFCQVDIPAGFLGMHSLCISSLSHSCRMGSPSFFWSLQRGREYISTDLRLNSLRKKYLCHSVEWE